jgi:transposase
MDKYIGFDIDDKKTVACIVQNNKKDIYDTIPTEVATMRHWLKCQRKPGEKLHLTFEVSGQAGWLYDELADLVDSLTVSNPSKMTWIYRTAKKTDRIDARKQAVLLQLNEIPKVHMPEKDIRQWRLQIQHRRKLICSSTQSKNRIRMLLKSHGYRQPEHKGSWWKKTNRQWMRELSGRIDDGWAESLADLLDQLELHERQIKHRTEKLDKRLSCHAGSYLLQTIPGVGPRTAEAVLAYTDEVERFSRSKDYCSYFGMTPKLDQSGSTRRVGHISKQGPSVVRWLIVESAWRAIKKSPSLAEFYERVRHGHDKRKKVAIVATARKMLSVMRAMLISGERFNEKLVLGQEQIKRARQKRERLQEEQRRRMRAFYN